MAEPILKWAGGKRQILTQIKGEFPPEEDINRYHEPFFGGGALFFRECHEDAATINDVNSRLMNFYRMVRDKPDKLIKILSEEFNPPNSPPEKKQDYSEEDNFYYQQRELFNQRPRGKEFEDLREAAQLLYLNRTCFNGLYRENQSGEFNVPIGNYANPDWVQSARITEASSMLEDVQIYNEDFSYVSDIVEEGDLVYCDPPYDPSSNSSTFAEYSSSVFGREEQERLRDLALDWNDKGAKVVISNAPSVREIYESLDEFRVAPVNAKRVINSNAHDRGEVKEVIISNVDNPRNRDTNLAEFNH